MRIGGGPGTVRMLVGLLKREGMGRYARFASQTY